jgi:polar amino acid transport system ATP-binding protein
LTVLQAVSFALGAGETLALVGPSGSGKTTLLGLCAGLDQPTTGNVRLAGAALAGLDEDARARVRNACTGFVFQNFNLFPHMSVQDNITLSPVRTLGVNKTLARTNAEELLERFGLADKVNAFPDQLSGGQQQRVAIVRALAIEPEVLLLDEITSSLDPELVGEVLDVVRELKKSVMTLVLATHEMGFARDISDLVCVLDDGHIIEQGLPGQVFSAPKSERAQQFLERIIRAGRL